jgi:hypothetical protein
MHARRSIRALGAAVLLAALAGRAAAAATVGGAAPPVAPAAAPAATAPAAAASGPASTPAAAASAPVAAPAPRPAAPPPEVSLSLKQGDWRVRVTIRPGEPKPGQLVDLRLEVARQREVPDPTYGEQVPVEGLGLQLAMSGPGSRVRYLARPLADVGSYGVHWTPAAKGLWTLQLAQLPGLEAGPQVSFEVGVGVPMPVSAQGQAVQVSRVVLGAKSKAQNNRPPLSPVMREVAQRWLKLEAAAGPEVAVETVALAGLFKTAQGRAPASMASAGAEFDQLVQAAAAEVERLGALPQQERAAAARAAEANTCLRCHLKFRDGVVEDLSKWPEVKPWSR